MATGVNKDEDNELAFVQFEETSCGERERYDTFPLSKKLVQDKLLGTTGEMCILINIAVVL
jgi:hypothetical protein